jgi:hypothetical protein
MVGAPSDQQGAKMTPLTHLALLSRSESLPSGSIFLEGCIKRWWHKTLTD